MTKKAATEEKDIPKVDEKTVRELIDRGKAQGYLTYDEINEVLSEEMLSAEQIDETFAMFDDVNIEILDDKKERVPI
jgi:RNA polymerase primary sigma factor